MWNLFSSFSGFSIFTLSISTVVKFNRSIFIFHYFSFLAYIQFPFWYASIFVFNPQPALAYSVVLIRAFVSARMMHYFFCISTFSYTFYYQFFNLVSYNFLVKVFQMLPRLWCITFLRLPDDVIQFKTLLATKSLW